MVKELDIGHLSFQALWALGILDNLLSGPWKHLRYLTGFDLEYLSTKYIVKSNCPKI